jgi:hypothetical protein
MNLGLLRRGATPRATTVRHGAPNALLTRPTGSGFM